MGHVVRMEDKRMPKEILEAGIIGLRIRRRPKRWLQVVKGDLRMKTFNWRWATLDRREWRRIVMDYNAQHGL